MVVWIDMQLLKTSTIKIINTTFRAQAYINLRTSIVTVNFFSSATLSANVILKFISRSQSKSLGTSLYVYIFNSNILICRKICD